MKYRFRTNNGTPRGSLNTVSVENRVWASLEDQQQAGLGPQYDWHEAVVGTDAHGEYVDIEINWPRGSSFGSAQPYLDRHDLIVDRI